MWPAEWRSDKLYRSAHAPSSWAAQAARGLDSAVLYCSCVSFLKDQYVQHLSKGQTVVLAMSDRPGAQQMHLFVTGVHGSRVTGFLSVALDPDLELDPDVGQTFRVVNGGLKFVTRDGVPVPLFLGVIPKDGKAGCLCARFQGENYIQDLQVGRRVLLQDMAADGFGEEYDFTPTSIDRTNGTVYGFTSNPHFGFWQDDGLSICKEGRVANNCNNQYYALAVSVRPWGPAQSPALSARIAEVAK